LYVLHRRGKLAVGSHLSLSDVAAVASTLLAVFALAFSLAAYQASEEAGERQQDALDASRAALEASIVVAKDAIAVAKQQHETAKSQQDLLSRSVESANRQLDLVERRQRTDEKKEARRPVIRVALGEWSWDKLRRRPTISLTRPPPSASQRHRMTFSITNRGTLALRGGVFRVGFEPESVVVAEAGHEPVGPHRNVYQTKLLDIHTGTPGMLELDILPPANVDAFTMQLLLTGENLNPPVRLIADFVIAPTPPGASGQ
jgi:hypothetical protein